MCPAGRGGDVEGPLTAGEAARLAVMATTLTVNGVLDGQVLMDLQCVDRVYLNAYLPGLQVGGQVVSF